MLIYLCVDLRAQSTKYTIHGIVKDSSTGELLIGANIKVLELKEVTVNSNEYGFYSLTLPKGNYTLLTHFIGYSEDTSMIELNNNLVLDIKLSRVERVLRYVKITSNKPKEEIYKTQSGVEKMEIEEVSRIPVLFGERDIVKTIQLLPGIKSVGDGNGGLYVRGGASDQNLVLLDEAIVYNASHLLGFFSAFNSDALKDVTVFKGTQPAQYGGRLSSALDIRMKDGNKQQIEASGSLGLISSKLSVEGPLKENKGSFFISGRRTYADLFLQLDNRYKGSQLYFYDINTKLNYNIGKKDALYLSGYFGSDKLGLKDLFRLNWGNATGTLRWNHLFNKKLFSNTSLIFSRYNYVVGIQRGGSDYQLNSNISDRSLKQEFHYYPNINHSLRFGFNSIYHIILPGEVKSETLNNVELQKQYSWENAIFISDEWKVNSKLRVTLGTRLSGFSVLGKGDFYSLDNTGNILDTTHYQAGQLVKMYVNPEPRFSLSYQLNASSSLKAAYSRNAQYLHLISNSIVSSPTDKWVSTNNNIKPELADQGSIGYFKSLDGNRYEFNAEVYYKYMSNQIDYRNGSDVAFSNIVETQLLSGIGRAYGIELLFKKKVGQLTGWISYTLSKTERKIENINEFKWYNARQDKPHDLSVVMNYKFNKKVDVSLTWVYSTGNAVTFPTGKYYVDQQMVWMYSERNGYRMPAYHRLDIGTNIKLKEHKHFTSELSVGIYNAYGRENAYSISFRENAMDPSKTEVVQTSLFKFVPSISWNFKIK